MCLVAVRPDRSRVIPREARGGAPHFRKVKYRNDIASGVGWRTLLRGTQRHARMDRGAGARGIRNPTLERHAGTEQGASGIRRPRSHIQPDPPAHPGPPACQHGCERRAPNKGLPGSGGHGRIYIIQPGPCVTTGRQLTGLRCRGYALRHPSRSSPDGGGRPQGGQGRQGPEEDGAVLGAHLRAGGGEGLRHAQCDMDRQAHGPLGLHAPHVRVPEDSEGSGWTGSRRPRSWACCCRSGARSTRRPSGFGSGSGR